MDSGKQNRDDRVKHREEPSSSNSVTAEEESSVPPGYWYSFRFIGSTTAIVLLANNMFIGYSMPVSRIYVYMYSTNTPR